MIFFRVLLLCTLGTFAVAAPPFGFLWQPHPKTMQCLPTTLKVLINLPVKVNMEQAHERMEGYFYSEDVSEHWFSSHLVLTSHTLVASSERD